MENHFPRSLTNCISLDSNRTLIWHCLLAWANIIILFEEILDTKYYNRKWESQKYDLWNVILVRNIKGCSTDICSVSTCFFVVQEFCWFVASIKVYLQEIWNINCQSRKYRKTQQRNPLCLNLIVCPAGVLLIGGTSSLQSARKSRRGKKRRK